MKEFMSIDVMKSDSALKRMLLRVFWTFVSLGCTALLVTLTDDFKNAAWYPAIQFLVNTIKDIANRNLPNLPKEM